MQAQRTIYLQQKGVLPAPEEKPMDYLSRRKRYLLNEFCRAINAFGVREHGIMRDLAQNGEIIDVEITMDNYLTLINSL